MTELNVEQVLKERGSAVGKLECVVVVGKAKDGSEWFASSMADGADALWYLERCKKMLLEIVDA